MKRTCVRNNSCTRQCAERRHVLSPTSEGPSARPLSQRFSAVWWDSVFVAHPQAGRVWKRVTSVHQASIKRHRSASACDDACTRLNANCHARCSPPPTAARLWTTSCGTCTTHSGTAKRCVGVPVYGCVCARVRLLLMLMLMLMLMPCHAMPQRRLCCCGGEGRGATPGASAGKRRKHE